MNEQTSTKNEKQIKENIFDDSDKLSIIQLINLKLSENDKYPDNSNQCNGWKLDRHQIIPDIYSELRTLQFLDLSHLSLKYIPDELDKLYLLTKLNLSCNFLEEVPNCIYNGLPRLKELNVSNNSINVFHLPKCMLSLSVLNIENNQLSMMPHWIWEYSCRLTELNINNNPLNMQQYGTMVKTAMSVSKLKKLSLTNCNFRTCDIIFLRNIPYLTYLNIGNDTKNNKNCWNFQLQVLHCRAHIEELLLNDLSITTLPVEINQLSSLKSIYLHNNIIYSIPNQFCVLDHLKICDLSNNQLTHLPNNFIKLKLLQELYLANNLLEQSPDMSQLHELCVLDLYNNFLINVNTVKLSYIESLDLDQNCFEIHDENYLNQKSNLRKRMTKETRLDGYKKQECTLYSHSPESICNNYTDEYESDLDNKENQSDHHVSDEENWDNNSDDDFIPKFSSKTPFKLEQLNEKYTNWHEEFVDAD